MPLMDRSTDGQTCVKSVQTWDVLKTKVPRGQDRLIHGKLREEDSQLSVTLLRLVILSRELNNRIFFVSFPSVQLCFPLLSNVSLAVNRKRSMPACRLHPSRRRSRRQIWHFYFPSDSHRRTDADGTGRTDRRTDSIC